MFSEIHVRTVAHEGEDYVNILDLSNHLTKALISFAEEVSQDLQAGIIDAKTYVFSLGIVEGLREAALLLAQGGLEMRIENEVNTLDDLINFQ